MILEQRVRAALYKINRDLPDEALEDAYRQIITFNSPMLEENNRSFHKLLVEGMEVSYKDNGNIRTKRAYIIDFDDKDGKKNNNEFLVVNQFTIIENEERRPDLIIFINGTPVVVVEHAYNQYFAVKKAIEKTKEATSEDGDRKVGVIWHTQGSGKSFSMVFYTAGLVRELNNPTIVVITDRNDLGTLK